MDCSFTEKCTQANSCWLLNHSVELREIHCHANIFPSNQFRVNKKMIWRNFCDKIMAVKSHDFHSVWMIHAVQLTCICTIKSILVSQKFCIFHFFCVFKCFYDLKKVRKGKKSLSFRSWLGQFHVKTVNPKKPRNSNF